ncbi:MAG: leucine-rich repeat protein [Lachnospiraceae bacterium]|nr:leucine-rich repeat protein [Lachnospiraceae bacterium]
MRKQYAYRIATMVLALAMAKETFFAYASPVSDVRQQYAPASSVVITDKNGADVTNDTGGYRQRAQDFDAPSADSNLTPKLALHMILEAPGEAEESLSVQEAFEDTLPSAYPARYDQTAALQNYLSGQMMPTRNQSPYGSCWAHAVIASMELYRNRMQGVPLDADDLSEYHLVHFSYGGGTTQTVSEEDTGDTYVFDGTKLSEDQVASYGFGGLNLENLTPAQRDIVFLDRGGNANDAGHALMHWKGAAAESDAPYPRADSKSGPVTVPSGGWDNVEYKAAARLENQYRVNLVADPELVKRFVREYGGVQTGYYHAAGGLKAVDSVTGEVIFDDTQGPGYFNAEHNSYNLPHVKGTNHAVTLVGWDDAFPKEYFNYQPEHDGAWLIRNSWNVTDHGGLSEGTYFWISYEDQTLNDTVYVYTLQEDQDRLDHNYYYDAMVHSSGGYPYSEYAERLAANVFTACGSQEQEVLSAVTVQETHSGSNQSTYADGGVPIEIRIYKNLGPSDLPDQGVLAYTQTGTLPLSGMYTIPLSQGVVINKGERFSVVIRMDEGRITPDIEYSYSDGYMRSYAACGKEGQSYYGTKDDESHTYSWLDHKTSGNGNFCIGAQTMEIPTLSVERNGANMTISWSSPAQAQGYELRSSSSRDGSYTTVFSTDDPAKSSFTAAASVLGDRYYRIYRRVAGVTNERSGSQPIFAAIQEEQQSRAITADLIDVSLPADTLVYNGNPHGVRAEGPSDYHGNLFVCYKRIRDGKGEAVSGESVSLIPPSDAGSYQTYVSATGSGKYAGAENLTKSSWVFTISPKEITSQNTVVTWQEDAVYNGKEHDFSEYRCVTCDGTVLALGSDKDFKVTYKAPTGRINAGTVTYTLHGLGNYTGKVSVTRQILPTALKESDVSFASAPDFTYDGTEKTPLPTVRFGAATLTKEKDYTLTYENHVHATTAASAAICVVTGKGNFTGSVEKTFDIKKRTLMVKAQNMDKAIGTEDPEFLAEASGAVEGEIPAFIGEMTRKSGEESGKSYAIMQGTYSLTDRASDQQGNGGFRASDYVMMFLEGYLSIKDHVSRTVTFLDPLAPEGSDPFGTVMVDDANTVTPLQAPERVDDSFAGWMIEEEGKMVPFDFHTPIRRDLTLLAAWECSHHEKYREIRNARYATAQETGYSGDLYCKRCGKLIQKGSAVLYDAGGSGTVSGNTGDGGNNGGGSGNNNGAASGTGSVPGADPAKGARNEETRALAIAELAKMGYTLLDEQSVQYSKCRNKNSKTIKVPDTVTACGYTFNVTAIGKNAFKGCKKLTRLTIGSNIKKIGKNTLKNCKKIKMIILRCDHVPAKRDLKALIKSLENKNAIVKVKKKLYRNFKTALTKAGFKGKIKKY